MPTRRRSSFGRRQALDPDALAWLNGKACNFFQFRPDAELEAATVGLERELFQDRARDGTTHCVRAISGSAVIISAVIPPAKIAFFEYAS